MLATYLFVSLKKTPFNSWNSLNLIPFYIYTLSLLHNYKLPKNIVLFSDLTIFIPIWINISQIWIYCNSIIYYGVAKLRNRNLELPWYRSIKFFCVDVCRRLFFCVKAHNEFTESDGIRKQNGKWTFVNSPRSTHLDHYFFKSMFEQTFKVFDMDDTIITLNHIITFVIWYDEHLEHEFDTSKEGIQLLLSAIYEENNYLREIRDSCKLDLVIKEKQLQKQTEYWTCGRGLTQTNEMFFQTLLTVKL